MPEYTDDEMSEISYALKRYDSPLPSIVAQYIFWGGQKQPYENRLNKLDLNKLEEFERNFVTDWRHGGGTADFHYANLPIDQKQRFEEVAQKIGNLKKMHVERDQDQLRQDRPPSPTSEAAKISFTSSYDQTVRTAKSPQIPPSLSKEEIIKRNTEINRLITERLDEVNKEVKGFREGHGQRKYALEKIQEVIAKKSPEYKDNKAVIDIDDIIKKLKTFESTDKEKFKRGIQSEATKGKKDKSEFETMRENCMRVKDEGVPTKRVKHHH